MSEKPPKIGQPPHLAERILEALLKDEGWRTPLGDFEEFFHVLVNRKGMLGARFWYWGQVLRLTPQRILCSIQWSLIMIWNHVKMAVRKIRMQKLYTIINIIGLTIGMVGFIFIFLWVQDELSYDRFHEKADCIYRVAVDGMINGTKASYVLTPALLGETLVQEYPEVVQATRIFKIRRDLLTRFGDRTFFESDVLFTDSSFFDVFSFIFIQGDPNSVLGEPDHVVMTQAAAEKYFGEDRALGRSLFIGWQNFTVAGVIEDVPRHSHFHFDFLLPLHILQYSREPNWMNNGFRTYIVLQPDASPSDVEAKFPALIAEHIGVFEGENWWAYYLQPLPRIHLYSHLSFEFERNGDAAVVYLLTAIAIFVIFIACINFMNLATALSGRRANEIGLRKIVGADRRQLRRQYLTESIIISMIALVLAIAVVYILLPWYQTVIGYPVALDLFHRPYFLPGLLGLSVLVGFISGSYPAIWLSSFHPVHILKGGTTGTHRSKWLRDLLVTFQFCVTVFLLIGTMVIYRQTEFIKNDNLGFGKENLMVIQNPDALGSQSSVFKEKLNAHPDIVGVAGSFRLPGDDFVGITFRPEGGEVVSLETNSCDERFLETLQIEMTKGRFFSREFSSDHRAVVLNEAAVKLIGWDDPLGKRIRSLGMDLTVIGVVEDFHYESMRQTIRPMALLHLNSDYNNYAENRISVRIHPENMNQAVTYIQETWKSFAPGFVFEYFFLSELYDDLYLNEQRTGVVTAVFSILAVFIAAIGLFGLASFMAAQRTKEIGIRKTLGASTLNVMRLLSNHFLLLVMIATCIAWPLAYFIMERWLRQFAYRIGFDPWIFIVSALFAMLVTMLTVSVHAIRAARANPVETLRYE